MADLRTAVAGHLRLRCAGRTLTEQSFAAPVHIGKAAEDAGRLTLQVVTPTAGLLEGDSLRVDVRVAHGARLVLTSPSALRLHDMPGGGCARVEQQFGVAQGCFFEYLPHLLIPQGGSALEQRTAVDVGSGGAALCWELLAPGRVAMGERLAFRSLQIEAQLRVEERLLALERYAAEPRQWPRVRGWGDVWVGTCLCVLPRGPESPESFFQVLRDLHGDDAWCGITRLDAPAAFLLRFVAGSSPALWRVADAARRLLYAAAGEPPPPRRV